MSARVIVAGLDPLGLAIVQRLRAAGAEVCALAAPAEVARYAHEFERIGAELITGAARSDGELLAAGLQSAAALVLTADDDAENVDAALTARRLRDDLPLVIRLFDPVLAGYVGETLDRATVLSMSAVTAPVFTGMAVRAMADGGQNASAASRARHREKRRWRDVVRIDRVVAKTIAGFLLLVMAATIGFSHMLDLRMMDALYFVITTVTTVGYGDIALRDASDTAKIAGMAVMFAGAAFLASLFAFLTGVVVARRQAALQGRVAVKGGRHVVVISGGNVGFRTAGMLIALGHRVVIVERRADLRNVMTLRAQGHHVIIADATVDETLALAAVDRAAVVMALTNSDATNLNIALKMRARSAGVPVVARFASPELAGHVSTLREAWSASSIAIASEKFAQTALAACGLEGRPDGTT